MKNRAPKAFDVVDGKIDRDRERARSAEQARHIEAAAYHASQARLHRVEGADGPYRCSGGLVPHVQHGGSEHRPGPRGEGRGREAVFPPIRQ